MSRAPKSVPLYDADEISDIEDRRIDMIDLLQFVFGTSDMYGPEYKAIVDAANERGFDFHGRVSCIIDNLCSDTASEIWCAAMRALGYTEEYDA